VVIPSQYGIHTALFPRIRRFFLEVEDARGQCWAASLGSEEVVAGSGGKGKGGGGGRVAKSLQSKTIHFQLAGTSARARVAHEKECEQGWRGPTNLGEAGTGWRRGWRGPAGAARRVARRGCSGGCKTWQ
jgi:hypothetical protein